MTSPEPSQHADAAALYALDALEADERGQFEQALLDSGELAQTVNEFEETAATLAYGAPSMPMAADLKDRLFQRISAEPVGPSSDLVQLLNLSIAELKQQAAELDWSSMPGNSGAEFATWQVDDDEREMAFFVRKADGGLFPNHAHASGETVLVLAGDFVVDSQVYGVGERVSSPGNTSHQPETRNGCLLFCVSSMDDDMLDD
ncbi:cupin domain-containing protein [Leptothoe spongobia]|uniref:Cupin domain-containing protein n=1 Tax=Leptothoe spongobia TAU-MAC 1115 TaxID=1967444 RepID=A0A947DG72_9CYAN|nr:cupin domain-containing protein [Leptothoe spongobia]MBT9316472.1 cupin domain-containing protein [Leptothoe spongobia TAU-MAC 1115]